MRKLHTWTNTAYHAGNMFTIHGSKIKIDGGDSGNGLFLAPIDGSAEIKVTRISENHASKVTGIMPTSAGKTVKLIIRTQYAGSNVFLKEPRVITSLFTLEEH